jgi:hypothetical protein
VPINLNIFQIIIYIKIGIREVKIMLFVLWFKWEPDKTEEVNKLWNTFKFPKEVKVIGRYLLIGRHISVAIFDAPSEEAILKITYPFRNLGFPHVNPALPLEESLKMMEKI